MLLKDELNAIQAKKKEEDHVMFERIVNTIVEDLKYNAETSNSTFVQYGVHSFVFNVPLHKEDYLPNEKPFIEVSIDRVAELKRHFEKEGITIDGACARSTGDGCISFSWD